MTKNNGYSNPFSVCFTIMKIRYNEYDKSIDCMNFVSPNDKINVFISLESVLNNLSMVKDIDSKLLLERNFPIILESEAINLCAHYKKFFKGNGLETNVFLYYTDLSSDNFLNSNNDEYRSFYLNKYLNNPKFQLLGNKMVDTIIPKIQKIMEFIPNVYLIKSKNIEGSLIPLVIANEYTDYKNFIISTDKIDTQYQLIDNFCMHYIKKSPFGTQIFNRFENYICDLFKEKEYNSELDLLKNKSFYSLLLSSCGDKIRSIDPLKGIGPKTIIKYLISGIENGVITKETSSIDLLSKIIPEDYQEQCVENFNELDIETEYKKINQQSIFDITNQIVDRFDYNSLIKLNQDYYTNFPLMLPELTC